MTTLQRFRKEFNNCDASHIIIYEFYVQLKKVNQSLEKKVIVKIIVLQGVVIRQRRAWRRLDGVFVYCEDNAGVIMLPKGDMKGS